MFSAHNTSWINKHLTFSIPVSLSLALIYQKLSLSNFDWRHLTLWNIGFKALIHEFHGLYHKGKLLIIFSAFWWYSGNNCQCFVSSFGSSISLNKNFEVQVHDIFKLSSLKCYSERAQWVFQRVEFRKRWIKQEFVRFSVTSHVPQIQLGSGFWICFSKASFFFGGAG